MDKEEYYKQLLIKAAKLITTSVLPENQSELSARRDLLSEIRDVDPHLYRFEIG